MTRIRTPWLLVADIERGGVSRRHRKRRSADSRRTFAVPGLCHQQIPRRQVPFDDGVELLEERIASPCFGVFPYTANVHLDAEDSLALDTLHRTPASAGGRIAIIRLPHLSNATDFRLLSWADWITSPPSGHYDAVILPGTKNTIADLLWLHGVGLADWVMAQHRRGATVVGICGGYQMLGRIIQIRTVSNRRRRPPTAWDLLSWRRR